MKNLLLTIFLVLFSMVVFSQTLLPTGSLNNARWSHGSHLLNNGKVLVLGGDNCNYLNYEVFASAELYDPSNGSWSFTGAMKKERTSFSSVLLNNGNVIAIGGEDSDGKRLSSCEIYNSVLGTWSNTGSLMFARNNHAAVVLDNGKVLVAGGVAKKTEIFSVETNTWTSSGDMVLDHGDGIAMILMDNGKVLATGGDLAPKKAEIYDPQTGQWTLLNKETKGNHYYHSIVRIAYGKYMIAGTQALSTADQLTVDIYYLGFDLFGSTQNLLTNIGVSPVIPVDGGGALIYSLGDFFSPTNTKCIQIYDPNTNIWKASPYNFLGANSATGHKLNDGSILLIGGSQTTGNGASANCLLVNQNAYTNCTPPELTYSVNGSVSCYGATATLDLPASEQDVTYEAYVANNFLGIMFSGGSPNTINISETKLAPGENIVKIKATKPGCPSYYLIDTAIVTVKVPDIPVPIISPGSSTICYGNSIELSAPEAMPGYLWNTGATTSKISVSLPGFFRVRLKDDNGCFTSYSEPVQITVNPTGVIAGPNLTVCLNDSPFMLKSFSPLGGIWTGSGVSSLGIFDPSLSGAGTFVLTYSLCGYSSTRTVTVKPLSKVNDFIVQAAADSVCYDATTSINILNSMYDATYQLRKGKTVLSILGGGAATLTFNTGFIENNTEFNIKAFYSNGCGIDSLVKYYTVNLMIDRTLNVGTKTPFVCKRGSTNVYIVKSQKDVIYQLKKGIQNIGLSKPGNGDTLYLPTGTLLNNATFSVTATKKTCTSDLLQTVFINVSGPSAYFTVSNYNPEAGENVEIINNSINPGGTYFWNFGSKASVVNSAIDFPEPVQYNETGSSFIKLICTSPEGCTDSLVRNVNIIAPVLGSNCNYSLGSIPTDTYEGHALTFDKNDNLYLFGNDLTNDQYNYSNYGDSLNLHFSNGSNYYSKNILIKYSAKGVLQWATYLRHKASAISGDVVTDSSGNVYVSYFHREYLDSIRFHSTNGRDTSIYPPHGVTDTEFAVVVAKYNKHGVLQWFQTFLQYYTFHKISLAIDKEQNVYVSGGQKIYKYSQNGNMLWNKLIWLSDIEIDSDGYLWGLSSTDIVVNKFTSDGNIIFSSPTPEMESRQQMDPIFMKMDEFGNMYIASYFRGVIKFNNKTITSKNYSLGGFENHLCFSKINNNGGQEWIQQMRVTNFAYFKGFDIKHNHLLMIGIGVRTSIIFSDSIAFADRGYFMAMLDTSGNNLMLKKATEDIIDRLIVPFDLLAFSRKSEKLAFLIPFSSYPVFGQLIPTMNLGSNQGNYVLMQGRVDCFLQLTPLTQFQTTGKTCLGIPIQFTDKTSFRPETWSWNFPGGNPSSSTEQNPIITYESPGNYEVTLATSNSYGDGNIVMKPLVVGEFSILSISPNKVCEGKNVDITVVGATDYKWNNGATGNTITLEKIIKDSTLIVTGRNDFGCESSKSHTINVETAPTIVIAPGLPISMCQNESPIILPEATPEGGVFTGSGIINGMFDPTLANLGINSIDYTYVNKNGCAATTTIDLVVNHSPEVTQTSFAILCDIAGSLILEGGTPVGGIYSGIGVTNGIFDPSSTGPGRYVITYTFADNNGCELSVEKELNVAVCDGIDNQNVSEAFVVYPNPSGGIITIESQLINDPTGYIRIYGVEGKCVTEKYLSDNVSNKLEIDLSHLSKGVYSLQYSNEKGITVHKIISVY